MELPIIAILLLSGLLVGFINTLAGGGSVISLTVFMALGLPVQVANGTNRVSILMQNISSTATFFRKRMLDVRLGLRLAVPVLVGALLGARVAVKIDAEVFQACLAVVMLSVLVFIVLGESIFAHSGERRRPIRWIHYVVFFLIGLYCGYIFVGTGYLVLLLTMGMLHFDIVRANVIKNFIILVSIPFSLAVFMINGDVNYTYGLVHGAGNMVGAFLASHYAMGWGTRFLRWFTAAVVVVCLADVMGIISIRAAVLSIVA